jgi:hypothetical protein
MGLGNIPVVFAGYHDVCFTSLFLPLRTPSVMTDVSLRPAAATTTDTGSPFLLDHSLVTGYAVKPVSRGWSA